MPGWIAIDLAIIGHTGLNLLVEPMPLLSRQVVPQTGVLLFEFSQMGRNRLQRRALADIKEFAAIVIDIGLGQIIRHIAILPSVPF